jgi:hypothetical protein
MSLEQFFAHCVLLCGVVFSISFHQFHPRFFTLPVTAQLYRHMNSPLAAAGKPATGCPFADLELPIHLTSAGPSSI